MGSPWSNVVGTAQMSGSGGTMLPKSGGGGSGLDWASLLSGLGGMLGGQQQAAPVAAPVAAQQPETPPFEEQMAKMAAEAQWQKILELMQQQRMTTNPYAQQSGGGHG